VPLEDAEICGLVTVDCKLGVSEPGMLVDQDHLSTYSGRFRPHNTSTRLAFKQDELDMPAHDTNLSRFSPVKHSSVALSCRYSKFRSASVNSA